MVISAPRDMFSASDVFSLEAVSSLTRTVRAHPPMLDVDAARDGIPQALVPTHSVITSVRAVMAQPVPYDSLLPHSHCMQCLHGAEFHAPLGVVDDGILFNKPHSIPSVDDTFIARATTANITSIATLDGHVTILDPPPLH